MKLCPRCFLPQLYEEEVMNSLSHDGKTYVCNHCGRIESFKKLNLGMAEGLIVGQGRVQAAIYGLNENRDPDLPVGICEFCGKAIRKDEEIGEYYKPNKDGDHKRSCKGCMNK